MCRRRPTLEEAERALAVLRKRTGSDLSDLALARAYQDNFVGAIFFTLMMGISSLRYLQTDPLGSTICCLTFLVLGIYASIQAVKLAKVRLLSEDHAPQTLSELRTLRRTPQTMPVSTSSY